MSAGWIFTDHLAYGVSVAARSVPTALSRSVAVPGAVETLAFGSAALGVEEDKVADQHQEIQAVSVTVCQCHAIVVHLGTHHGIAGGVGHGLKRLFMSHPSLDERIVALREPSR